MAQHNQSQRKEQMMKIYNVLAEDFENQVANDCIDYFNIDSTDYLASISRVVSEYIIEAIDVSIKALAIDAPALTDKEILFDNVVNELKYLVANIEEIYVNAYDDYDGSYDEYYDDKNWWRRQGIDED